MTRILAIIALAGALVLGVAAPATADVDDFYFESFHGHYSLSIDGAGHSQLTTVETLVAVFPEFDQNRGIRRLLVDRYDGHPTDIRVRAVTDENGTPREFETDTDDGFLQVIIAGDDYVHGKQTYVITYTQSNVTKFFADTDSDEFYWDTNGTEWSQLFSSVTATVDIDERLRSRLNGSADAVSGFEGDSGPATITETDTGYVFEAGYLAPGQNLTFAIGFEPGTFEPRESGFFAGPAPSIALFFSVGGLVALWLAVRLRVTRLRDAPGRPTIVAEYLPPKGSNVLIEAALLGRSGRSAVAGILKLAVAGNLRVLEVPGKKSKYRLQLVSTTGADDDEQDLLRALFSNRMKPGMTIDLKQGDQKRAARVSKAITGLNGQVVARGLRVRTHVGMIAGVIVASALCAIVGFIASIVSLEQAYGGWLPGLFLGLAVVVPIATIVLVARAPFTADGAELRDHLKGLEEYIRLAEADRIRFLQSPEGALRVPQLIGDRAADAAAEGRALGDPRLGNAALSDTAVIVKLNERLLPYAALFGLEKQWAAELGRYYEQLGEQPAWYAGQGAFNAALFSSSIGSMAASTASAYSSSAGGSGGGASSGGGGGGGGGGGV